VPPASPPQPIRAHPHPDRPATARGITGIYTATTDKFAVISVTASLTVWTNGQQLWCNRHGQRHTWPAADMEAAATGIAGLARL
jgi:hypothetical protein